MENPDRKIELTKQEIDKNTPLMRKIEKICKNIDFKN